MRLKHATDISINAAIFYLKMMGVWFAVNRAEKYFRNFTVIYSIISLVFITGLQFRALYVCWDDPPIRNSSACNIVGLVLSFLKFLLVMIQKKKFFQLIRFMQKNFWHSNYDFHEKRIVASVKKMCTYLVCTFSFLTQLTVVCYIFKSVILNIGRNASDRTLMFPMWLDESWNETPYFEIEYVIQALSSFQAAISFLCFDNIFCIICLHAAGQFRILQYRMTNIHELQNTPRDSKNVNENVLHLSEICLDAFRNCIKQHQALIEFCKLADEVFREIMLLQVLIFSMLICLAGYQTFVETLNLPMRVTFASFLITTICQLWMFTYSCSSMTHASVSVIPAVYAFPWTNLSMNKFGKMIRKDVQFVIMRSSRACYINAWRFFPISLETFTKIMHTAMSYFTILRQSTLDPANT